MHWSAKICVPPPLMHIGDLVVVLTTLAKRSFSDGNGFRHPSLPLSANYSLFSLRASVITVQQTGLEKKKKKKKKKKRKERKTEREERELVFVG